MNEPPEVREEDVRLARSGRCSPAGTAMPDLSVGAGDARDITAFLYTRAK
jgi:hypothetical protein